MAEKENVLESIVQSPNLLRNSFRKQNRLIHKYLYILGSLES
jgi:hypothetical protein